MADLDIEVYIDQSFLESLSGYEKPAEVKDIDVTQPEQVKEHQAPQQQPYKTMQPIRLFPI